MANAGGINFVGLGEPLGFMGTPAPIRAPPTPPPAERLLRRPKGIPLLLRRAQTGDNAQRVTPQSNVCRTDRCHGNGDPPPSSPARAVQGVAQVWPEQL